jgi:hypothetical protein
MIVAVCRNGQCRKRSLDLTCEVGLRTRQYHVLSGSVLSVWSRVESVLSGSAHAFAKMQIMRLRTEDGQRIVGMCSFLWMLVLFGFGVFPEKAHRHIFLLSFFFAIET